MYSATHTVAIGPFAPRSVWLVSYRVFIDEANLDARDEIAVTTRRESVVRTGAAANLGREPDRGIAPQIALTCEAGGRSPRPNHRTHVEWSPGNLTWP